MEVTTHGRTDAIDPNRASEAMHGRRPVEELRAAVGAIPPALYVQARGLRRSLCQAHREQRLCNWIVGEGPQNILVVTGSPVHFALLEI